MKQIHKDYERPFLLETTKLDRLMDTVHGLQGKHQNTTKREDFEVFLSEERREKMTNVGDVVKLDNSRRSKIQRLLITCCASTGGEARPEHEIQVDFDGRSIGKTKITVSIKSDDAGWSSRALSEVEEQLERTSLGEGPSRVVLACLFFGLLGVLAFLLLSSFAGLNSGFRDADAMWLRLRDVGRIEQILKQERTITDEEMREIATMQLRNVIEANRESQPTGWTRQKAFIGVPLLVVLGCVIYLAVRCYPTAVFLWGDEIERNAKLLQTRRILWGLIIGGIGFGLLSKVLFAGVVPGP